MQRGGILIVLALAATGTAAAQTPEPTESSALVFQRRMAEQLVAEQLVADGIALSNGSLKLTVEGIEGLAGKWIISLIDLTTHRVIATIKIKRVPEDYDAMAILMFSAAADLESQLLSRNPLLPRPWVNARTARVTDEVAELQFRCGPLRLEACFWGTPLLPRDDLDHNKETEPKYDEHDDVHPHSRVEFNESNNHRYVLYQSKFCFAFHCEKHVIDYQRYNLTIIDTITSRIAEWLRADDIQNMSPSVARLGSNWMRSTITKFNLTLPSAQAQTELSRQDAYKEHLNESLAHTNTSFFEQRVADELENEGILLSRRNLGLKIERLGSRWLISLIRLNDGHAAASTRIDQISTDREAAIATLTHIAADLESQIGDGNSPFSGWRQNAGSTSPIYLTTIHSTENARRILAQNRFEHESLQVVLSNSRKWIITRGNSEDKIIAADFDEADFYQIIGRNDLARYYRARELVMFGGFIMGAAAAATTAVLSFEYFWSSTCNTRSPADFLGGQCVERSRPDLSSIFIWGNITISATLIGSYFYLYPHPIDQNEANLLVHDYNRRLRSKLRLSKSDRQTSTHNMRLIPYSTIRNTGLIFDASF